MKDEESPFKWEKNDVPIKTRPICRLEPKPKMSVDAIIGTGKKGADSNSRFSLLDQGRFSIFSSDASTQCMSKVDTMDSSVQSMLSGQFGTSFTMDNESSFVNAEPNRPTIGLGKQFSRRATYGGISNAIIIEDNRESCESINNRASELEGTINTP